MTDNSSIDTSVTNIWRAWRAFRRGKKPSRAIVVFESELEVNLLRLAHDINTDNYIHGGYDHKIINDKKRRDIRVASVRDRVVHRLLYDYLLPIINPQFDYDVWSCRPGKGLHGGLVRTQQLFQSYPAAWAWRADIRKCFDSVDHEVLERCVSRHVQDKRAYNLIISVIQGYAVRQTDRQTDRQTSWYADWQPDQPTARQYLFE